MKLRHLFTAFSSLLLVLTANSQGVGINQTSPASMLDVNGGVTIGGTYSGTNAAPANGLIVEGNVGIGTTAANAPLSFGNSLGDKIYLYDGGEKYGFGIQGSLLQIFSGASTRDIAFGYGTSGSFTEKVRFEGDGDVGIGTATPTAGLQVEKSIDHSATYWTQGTANIFIENNHASGNAVLRMSAPNTAAARIIYGNNGATDKLIFSSRQSTSTTTGHVVMDNSGNLGIGTTSPGGKLHVANTFDAANARATHIYLTDPGNANLKGWIGLNQNTAAGANKEYLSIQAVEETVHWLDVILNGDGTGSVGIGTTEPAAKLDVNGTGSFAGNVDMNGYDIDFENGSTGSIRSIGEISFDWNGVYDSPQNHGIQSKNEAGNWGDELRINSFNDVIVTIDANNNDAASNFKVQEHSTTDGTDLFTVSSPSGTGYFSGSLGIGSATPAEELDVVGDIAASGTVYYGSSGIRTETRDDAGDAGVGIRSGFYQTSTASTAENWPENATWYHLLDVRHTNTANNYAMQFSGSFFNQKLYFRKTANNAATGWKQIFMADGNGDLDLENNKIVNLSDPNSNQDAATKAYVDAATGSPGSYQFYDTGVVQDWNNDATAVTVVNYSGSGIFYGAWGFSNWGGAGFGTGNLTVTIDGVTFASASVTSGLPWSPLDGLGNFVDAASDSYHPGSHYIQFKNSLVVTINLTGGSEIRGRCRYGK